MLRRLACPHCGAPLPAIAAMAREAVCSYCGLSFPVEPDVVRASDFRAAREAMEREAGRGEDVVRLRGVAYRRLGKIARGESSDVFLAVRITPLPERVVLKVLRAEDDADLLAHEHEVLCALHASSAPGTQTLARRIAQPVAFGPLEGGAGDGRPATAHRYVSGFFATFADVRHAYPGGIDPRAATWMWRRILEALAWVHASGWVHAAIVPPHLIIHPRDHGAMLVGWSCAVTASAEEPPRAFVGAHQDLYPDDVRSGHAAHRGTDLTMAARCVAGLLGVAVEPLAPSSPFTELLGRVASGRDLGLDAWSLHRAVGDAARETFGPAAYHPFAMPGWS